jgi:hypothetical protein
VRGVRTTPRNAAIAAMLLKIFHKDPTTGSKRLAFDATATIYDVVIEVCSRLGIAAEEFGIFCPAASGPLVQFDAEYGKWLDQSKEINSFPLISQSYLELKRKVRTLRVNLLDGSYKMLRVDETVPTRDIVAILLEKLGVSASFHVAEFSLQMDSGQRCGLWLQKQLSLSEQGVQADDILLLLQKYHVSIPNEKDSESVVDLHFADAVFHVISGGYRVGSDEAKWLAGLQLQADFGDFSSAFISYDVKLYMPKHSIPSSGSTQWKSLEADLRSEHRRCRAMSRQHAKWRYLEIVKRLQTFGSVLFMARERAVLEKGVLRATNNVNALVPVCLYFCAEGILVYPGQDLCSDRDKSLDAVDVLIRIEDINRYASVGDCFTLDLGYRYRFFHSTEVEEMSSIMGGYIAIIKSNIGRGGKAMTQVENRDSLQQVTQELATLQGQVFKLQAENEELKRAIHRKEGKKNDNMESPPALETVQEIQKDMDMDMDIEMARPKPLPRIPVDRNSVPVASPLRVTSRGDAKRASMLVDEAANLTRLGSVKERLQLFERRKVSYQQQS